jgi:hypothetical protein
MSAFYGPIQIEAFSHAIMVEGCQIIAVKEKTNSTNNVFGRHNYRCSI